MEQVAENTSNEVAKTTIRPKTENMIKTPGGSFHTNDTIGNTLAGLTVAQVIEIGKDAGIAVEKYSHLNPGQQRMTIGNALRKIVKEEAKAIRVTELADGFKEANAAEAKRVADEKAAAKAAKAAETPAPAAE